MVNEMEGQIELVFTGDLTTRTEVERLCARARRSKYRAVAVPSGSLLLAQHFLEDSEIKICCRIGFPHGSSDPDVKRYETEFAVDAGAHEIEVVPSLARVDEGNLKAVLRELRDVVDAADERPVKVAIEPAQWNRATLGSAIQTVLDSGAQYLSLTDPDSALEDVLALRKLVGSDFGIMGSVETEEHAAGLILAGANLVAWQIASP